MITITSTGTMAYIYLLKPFRCCSHKCLYGEAGAAALIDVLLMRDLPRKNRTIFRGNTFSVLLTDSFIELPGSNLKSLGKARTLLTRLSRPKKGKTKMQHNA